MSIDQPFNMDNKTIENKDITIVVQGPVLVESDSLKPEITTKKCIDSINTLLPGATIILSTWENMKTDHLEYDLLIENDDPGQNKITHPPYSDRIANDNRQIKSTVEGLKIVKTKYAMKLRSDNYLVNTGFKELFNQFQERCEDFKILDRRVISCSTFCREIQKGGVVTFQPCDFFHFGLTTDLLKIWDIPFFPKVRETRLQKWQQRVSTEQYLWLSFIQKYHDDISIYHLFDNDKGKIEKSRISLINNLVIAEHEQIGLGLPKRFHLPLKTRCTFISFMRWKILYRKYCQNDFPIPGRMKFSFFLLVTRLWFYGRKKISYNLSTLFKKK